MEVDGERTREQTLHDFEKSDMRENVKDIVINSLLKLITIDSLSLTRCHWLFYHLNLRSLLWNIMLVLSSASWLLTFHFYQYDACMYENQWQRGGQLLIELLWMVVIHENQVRLFYSFDWNFNWYKKEKESMDLKQNLNLIFVVEIDIMATKKEGRSLNS